MACGNKLYINYNNITKYCAKSMPNWFKVCIYFTFTVFFSQMMVKTM
jgi:hypothetical protein